jgi:hypothetical protein
MRALQQQPPLHEAGGECTKTRQSARNASAILMQPLLVRVGFSRVTPELLLSLLSLMPVESVYDATVSGFDPIRALNQPTRLRATGTE